MSRRNKLVPYKTPQKASLEEKLDIYFLNIRKGEQIRRNIELLQMNYISLFWEIAGSAMAVYFDQPEDWYLQQFLIFAATTTLNCLSHYIWASYQPNEPLAIGVRDFTKEDKDFYTHLTSKQAKQKMAELNECLTLDKLMYIVNTQSKKRVLHHFYSTAITSALDSFSNPSYGILICKNFFTNFLNRRFAYAAAYNKLSGITNSLITQDQLNTIKSLEKLFTEIFKNLEMEYEEYLPAGKDKISEDTPISFSGLFETKDSRQRFLIRNEVISRSFYIENIFILNFYFSKDTKINNQSNVLVWDHLIHLLAQRLHQQFSNIILEILPSTLKIAILPMTVKSQPELSVLLPELQMALELGAVKMEQAYAHSQELDRFSSMIALSPWQTDFYVDKNYFLQATLINHVNTLKKDVLNELITGLKEENYQVQESNGSLRLQFHTNSAPLLKLEERLRKLYEKNSALKPSSTGKHKQIVSQESFFTYFPEYKENKTCSFFSVLRGVSDRARRYATQCFWQENVKNTVKQPAAAWSFGEYGTYVETSGGDAKVTDSATINQKAIFRLKNLNGAWTNQFVVVTDEMVAEIATQPPAIQKNIWEYIARAQIVPHHSDDKHQKSGFVITKEALKKDHSPVWIKLTTSQTPLRLYAQTAVAYEQTGGEKLTLYVLDKFENLHKKTVSHALNLQPKLVKGFTNRPA